MSALRAHSKHFLVASAAVLSYSTLSLAQTGPQITVSPGIITTVAGHTNATLAAATFNGVAVRGGTVYFSDSHTVGYTSGGNAITVGNVYALDLNSGQVTRIAGAVPDPVAGNTSNTLNGDGGPATSARLNQPAGLAIDAAGNLYIADERQNAVRKVDANGTITTVAGNGNPDLNAPSGGDGGPATSAKLTFPTALAFNSAGDLYISETIGARVRVVSAATQIITTVAGNGTRAHSGDNGPAVNASLDSPQGIAVDQNNNLYIADSATIPNGSELLRKVSNGTITTVATGLSNPYGVGVDASGIVYIADSLHNKILRLGRNGQVSTVAGSGTAGLAGDGGPALTASLTGPAGLAVSANNDIYFVDSGQTSAVRRITGTPAPVVFPLTANNTASASRTITISASGGSDLNITGVNPPTNFTVTGGSCGAAPFTLTSGTSCTIDLTLTPNNGITSGNLTIVSNAGNASTVSVLLSMSNGLYFVPVTPCRVVDTRWPTDTFGSPSMTAEQIRSFAIRFSANSDNAPNGRFAGACGSASIPSGADVQAYSLNVTVVPKASSLRWLTVAPKFKTSPTDSGVDPNGVSNLNSYDGKTKAIAAIVPADTSDNNRAISVFAKDATDVIIDINGYYVPESTPSSLAYYPLPPCRAVDTRDATRGSGLGAPSMGNESRTFSLQASGCGLPSSAQALALNFTAVPKTSSLAYLTVWPGNQAQPFVSTLNATTGSVTANAAIVPVSSGSNGQISVYSTDPVDLIVDISGYYAPPGTGGLALYNVTPPCRAADTRGSNLQAPPVSGVYNVNIAAGCNSISGTAQGIVLNSTVVPAASLSYITLWGRNTNQPLQSTLNAYDYNPGIFRAVSNLAVVPTTDGWISSYSTAPTALIFDVFGYFAP